MPRLLVLLLSLLPLTAHAEHLRVQGSTPLAALLPALVRRNCAPGKPLRSNSTPGNCPMKP